MRNCVKGKGNYVRSLSDTYVAMSVENKSVFGCAEVQQRCDSDSARGVRNSLDISSIDWNCPFSTERILTILLLLHKP